MGAVVVEPVSKQLACGDIGVGAMASPESISAAVQQHLPGAGGCAGGRQLGQAAWHRLKLRYPLQSVPVLCLVVGAALLLGLRLGKLSAGHLRRVPPAM